MEDLLPFLTNKNYVKSKNVKSIKLFLKLLDEPSLPNEIYAFRFDFSSDGLPKLMLAFDKEGNIGEQTEYNVSGKKIKKIENHYHTATRQRPEIDTIIYKYNNDLLIEEEEINEDNSFGVYRKEVHYKRVYKYDRDNRLIEKQEHYLPTNSVDIDKYEYVNSNLMKEFDIMSDGRINMIIFHKYDNQGNVIEKKAVKTEEEYYDPNYKYQYYRHSYTYNNLGLLKEMQSFDNENNLKSNLKYIYDTKNILLRAEQFEKGKLSTIWRFEYSFYGFLNTIFG